MADLTAVIDHLLASDPAEALAWLLAAPPGGLRTLGESTTPEESLALVRRLYDLGAVTVLAAQIDRADPPYENTGHLLVRLPDAADARARLFAFERALVEPQGFDGETDAGQPYLFLKFD
jgi:hypothetical protein